MLFTKRELICAAGGVAVGVGLSIAAHYIHKSYKRWKEEQPHPVESDDASTQKPIDSNKPAAETIGMPVEPSEPINLSEPDETVAAGRVSPIMFQGGRDEYNQLMGNAEASYWKEKHQLYDSYAKDLRKDEYPEVYVEDDAYPFDEEHMSEYVQYIGWYDPSTQKAVHPYTQAIPGYLTWVEHDSFDPSNCRHKNLVWCKASQEFVDAQTYEVDEDAKKLFEFENALGNYEAMIDSNHHFDLDQPIIQDDITKPPVWYGPVLCFKYISDDPNRESVAYSVTTVDESIKSLRKLHGVD